MVQTSKTIARNTTILMGSQMAMWLLSTAIMIGLPRYLGAEGVGKLQIANSLWLMISVFVAFGTDILLTKEIARDKSQTSRLLGVTIVLRSLLFVVGCGLMAIVVQLLDYPTSTLYVIGFLGIVNLLRSWISAYQAAFQGLEQMGSYAIGDVTSNALFTVLGLTLLVGGWGIYAIIILMTVVAIINLAIHHFFLNQAHKVQLIFDTLLIKQILRSGVPYLLSSFFLVAYMQIDVIVISWFVDEQTIGWYSAASRLFGTLLFIPTVYITAVFPTFSRLSKSDMASLQKLISKSFDMLFLLGVPIGLGILAIAKPLVLLLFGETFEKSGPVLAIFGIVLILTYQNILVGRFLISVDRQKAWTWVMAIATVATIPLDIVLIPWCAQLFQNGAIGGTLSFVITELGMLVAGLTLLPKGSLGRANFWKSVRILLAGIGMVAVVWQLQGLFLGIPILVGLLAYSAFILLLRVIPKEDITLLRQTVQQIQAKWHRPQTSALGG